MSNPVVEPEHLCKCLCAALAYSWTRLYGESQGWGTGSRRATNACLLAGVFLRGLHGRDMGLNWLLRNANESGKKFREDRGSLGLSGWLSHAAQGTINGWPNIKASMFTRMFVERLHYECRIKPDTNKKLYGLTIQTCLALMTQKPVIYPWYLPLDWDK